MHLTKTDWPKQWIEIRWLTWLVKKNHIYLLMLSVCLYLWVYPTDLQSTVEEAAVLSRLVAQAFARCDGGHGSWGHQPLHPASCSATRSKVVPLPRHHYLDAPVSTARRRRGGAEDQVTASMSLPWARKRENEKRVEEEEMEGWRGGRRQLWSEEMRCVLVGDLVPIQPSPSSAEFLL